MIKQYLVLRAIGVEKADILWELAQLKGSSRRKTIDERLHKARESAFEMLEAKFR